MRVLLLCAVAALAALSGCKKSSPTLSLLVWEGYADPSFIRGFEAQCQCRVSAAYMGSSDELVAKLRGGAASNYDVISPSSDVATMLSRSGLVAPLDLSKVSNYGQLSPKPDHPAPWCGSTAKFTGTAHLGPRPAALRPNRLCQTTRDLG